MKSIKSIDVCENFFTINFCDSTLKLNSFEDNRMIYIDITKLNLIKAIQVAILTSTHCFLNEFVKDICWLVKDIEIKRAISILCLKNTKCLVDDLVKTKTREIA